LEHAFISLIEYFKFVARPHRVFEACNSPLVGGLAHEEDKGSDIRYVPRSEVKTSEAVFGRS
jgi:hypothetical protein